MRLQLLALVCTWALFACSSSTPAPTRAPFGDACDDGCEPLSCLNDPRFPGGYCTSGCNPEECGAGAACLNDFGADICFATCSAPTDCRSGYQCWRGVCRPPCGNEAECGGDGALCTDGTCTGVECNSAAECAPGNDCIGGRCVPSSMPDAGMDAPPPGDGGDCGACDGVCRDGACLPACTDRSSCGTPALVCAPVVDGGRVATVCIDSQPAMEFLARACSSDDQCESSTCFEGQCTEVCDDDGDCLPGHTCRVINEAGIGEYSACWYADPAPAWEDFLVTEGRLNAGSMLPRANFAVAPDALSVTFVVEQDNGGRLPLSFFNVFDPTGLSLFDLREIAELRDTPVRWLSAGSEAISMLVPNSTPDRVQLVPGRHAVIAGALTPEGGSAAAQDARVRAIVRRGAAGGTLRLRFHIAPGLGFSAANAGSISRLSQSIARVNAIYAGAGINVTVAGYENLSSGAYSIIDSIRGNDSEMGQMFRTSAPTDDNVINVFLVRAIQAGGGGTLGVAGGIPGPAGTHGTSQSGVVVSFDTSIVGGNGTFAGQIMAHELGHYLGLFHGTEQDNMLFGGADPIADTTTGDRRNLMYFSVQMIGGSLNDQLSNGQNFVISRNAHVSR